MPFKFNPITGQLDLDSGGSSSTPPPGSQLYAYQSGSGYTLASGANGNTLQKVDTIDGAYTPDEHGGSMMEYDFTNHKINILRSGIFQVAFTIGWNDMTPDTNPRVSVQMHSNNAARFYWSLNFPGDTGAMPKTGGVFNFPMLIFGAGDVLTFTTYNLGTILANFNYTDIEITAVAITEDG